MNKSIAHLLEVQYEFQDSLNIFHFVHMHGSSCLVSIIPISGQLSIAWCIAPVDKSWSPNKNARFF